MVALNVLNAQVRPFTCCGTYNNFAIDIADNIYLTDSRVIEKYDKDGNLKKIYSNPKLGNIECVDANISSKILVYHKESGIINILNDDLSQVGNSLDLFSQMWFNIDFAAMGSSNKIIMFDKTNNDLIITDLNLKSISVSHIVFPRTYNVSEMQVTPEHKIALIDTMLGVCFFDIFGTFEKEIPLGVISAFHLNKDSFFYIKKGKLFKYFLPNDKNPLSVEEIELGFDIGNAKKFSFCSDSFLYIDSDNKLYFIAFR